MYPLSLRHRIFSLLLPYNCEIINCGCKLLYNIKKINTFITNEVAYIKIINLLKVYFPIIINITETMILLYISCELFKWRLFTFLLN